MCTNFCAVLSLAARQCPTVSDSIARQRPDNWLSPAFIPYLVANHMVNFPSPLPNSSKSSVGQKASAGSITSSQIAFWEIRRQVRFDSC